MLSLARGGFTALEVRNALHALYHPRYVRFKYHLLDANENFIRALDNVIDAEVSCSSLAHVKRTANFTLRDDGDIDYLSDRIQPFMEVYVKRMPHHTAQAGTYFLQSTFPAQFRRLQTSTTGGWASFPLGIFLLSSPTKSDDSTKVIREVEAYDGLIVLKEDRFTDRYTIPAGTNYVDAVVTILQGAGITKWNIEQTDKVLDKAIEFEPGREKLFAINEILRQINYDGIKVDVYGYYTSSYYRSPTQRAPEYTYVDDRESVTLPGMAEEFDLTEAPNQFVVVRTNAEQPPLRSVYTNDDPNSPISTVNRGTAENPRYITDYREIEDIADQEALDGYVQRIASNASQVYGKITFDTALMPFHDIDDVLNIQYSKLGISAKYSETKWSMPLQIGSTMSHELRRSIGI